MKLYFHMMTDKEWDKRCKARMTWGEICKIYSPPEWCRYDGALEGQFGCCSLVARLVKNEAYCEGCECHKDSRKRQRRDAKRRW